MRTTSAQIALAATALVTAGLLTGCTQEASSASDDSCVTSLSSGALSKGVTVLGEFGTTPEVQVPTDISYTGAQRYAAHTADDRGRSVTEASAVTLSFALYASGETEAISSSGPFESPANAVTVPFDPEVEQGALVDALQCAAPGDRLVITLSADEVEAMTGGMMSADDVAIAAVVDVRSVQPMVLDGAAKELPAGFPAVVTNEQGQPGVIATPAEAPTAPRSATRITGDGDTVTAEQVVHANILQVTWDGWRQDSGAGQVRLPFMNTRSGQGSMDIGPEATDPSAVRTALTGQTVGSQVVVLEPNDQYGAMVYVVDILAAK